MKEIFDFKRFGKYFVSDMRSCAANYGYSLALICLMGVIIYVGTVTMGLLFNASWGGPECGFRNSVFWLSMFVMAVTMPVKCYGSLTEKRAGSQWLMIPASKFEKFLSMVLITAIVIPAVALGVTLGLDALLCAVDQTCGDSIISSMKTANAIHDDSAQTINSIISLALSFLLGAIFFKSSKTVKTFLVLFALGTVTMTVLFTMLFNGVNVAELVENEALANEIVGNGPFGNNSFIPVLCCTVSYVLLLTGIFFRIKTLKH
jgi:hypothetical protein